jgi:hypothetical protein
MFSLVRKAEWLPPADISIKGTPKLPLGKFTITGSN